MLQDLYDSEINASISWNWDAGVEVRLGNGLYGDEKNWEASDNVKTIQDAEEWLVTRAIELYPNSVFAKKYSTSSTIPGFENTESQLENLRIK